jgi:ribose 5-phosphate isomerase B
MKIAIGNDHAGYKIKKVLKEWLLNQGYDIVDFGSDSEEPVDYPDIAHPLASSVEKGEFDTGILICGAGEGATITANKHQGIRATLCWMPEIARLSRAHNDANILCLPGRFIEGGLAIEVLKTFLVTPFDGGRHKRRIDKVPIK